MTRNPVRLLLRAFDPKTPASRQQAPVATTVVPSGWLDIAATGDGGCTTRAVRHGWATTRSRPQCWHLSAVQPVGGRAVAIATTSAASESAHAYATSVGEYATGGVAGSGGAAASARAIGSWPSAAHRNARPAFVHWQPLSPVGSDNCVESVRLSRSAVRAATRCPKALSRRYTAVASHRDQSRPRG
jgi:hypothetical protein